MTRALWSIVAGVWVVGLGLGCGRAYEGSESESQTHWLKSCSTDAACGQAGLSCICGACVSACDSAEACDVAGHATSCHRADSAEARALCGRPAPKAVCLEPCTQSCPGGHACVSGVCVTAATSGGRSGSSAGSSGGRVTTAMPTSFTAAGTGGIAGGVANAAAGEASGGSGATPGAAGAGGVGGAVASAATEAASGGSGGLGPWATGGYGGDSGAGPDLDCMSPVSRTPSAWVSRNVVEQTVAEELAAAHKALVGDFHGVVTTEWVQPYSVMASFRDDGSYSARCENNSDFFGNDASCCRAFYYGSDRDSALKRWSLSSVNADGSVGGQIDIAFCYGDQECSLPAWQGELQRVEYDASGNRVRFEFSTGQGGTPIVFDLERD